MWEGGRGEGREEENREVGKEGGRKGGGKKGGWEGYVPYLFLCQDSAVYCMSPEQEAPTLSS